MRGVDLRRQQVVLARGARLKSSPLRLRSLRSPYPSADKAGQRYEESGSMQSDMSSS